MESRFHPGQHILVARSGRSSGADCLVEVLQVIASEQAEIYRVRWTTGLETFFVPGPDAHDRRLMDVGPPPGTAERRYH
jgi:hypothetical protein